MALLSFPGELWMKALKALVLPLIVCNVALSACELRRRAGGNPSFTGPPSSCVLRFLKPKTNFPLFFFFKCLFSHSTHSPHMSFPKP